MREAPDFRYVVQGGGRMDQRGTADLAQFLPPPSNSGPQEMERIAGSVKGHLLLLPPAPSLGTSLVMPTSVYTLLLPSLQKAGWVRI